jgi:hypothetical protein
MLVATRVHQRFASDVKLAITRGFTGADALVGILCASAVVFTNSTTLPKAIVGAGNVLARITTLRAKSLTVAGAAHADIEVASPFATDVQLCRARRVHTQFVATGTAPNVATKLTTIGILDAQVVALVDSSVAIECPEQNHSRKQSAPPDSMESGPIKISHTVSPL